MQRHSHNLNGLMLSSRVSPALISRCSFVARYFLLSKRCHTGTEPSRAALFSPAETHSRYLCNGTYRALLGSSFQLNRIRTMAATSRYALPKHVNRLATEESPYLLQHAHNPVDWYPWGQEAFTKAKEEDKPIFLSVGYSTCHWCHVMERESFESEGVAAIMNQYFVNIKVDREERPDVDKVYMTYVQATQGGGGWPMSVFLTPDLEPFLGGTYFPPTDMYGRPSFSTVLSRIAEVWSSRKEDVKAQSADSMQQLEEATRSTGSACELDVDFAEAAMDSCAAMLSSRFDARRGGFGPAPKFPRPAEINLMLHQYKRVKEKGDGGAGSFLEMSLASLRAMARGGMYDHLGGGFHRYSVDEYWHVPHFEKMLYDNPQLVVTYLNAFQISRDASLAFVARGVLDYLIRDMQHPLGGLYAAEDADSLDTETNEKKEGAFYIWSYDEIQDVLGPDAQMFCQHYGVKPEGNCTLSPRSDPHKEFAGKNVLYEAHSMESTARESGDTVDSVAKRLAQCRERLFKSRNQRPRPHRDEKVVAAWNGMAISAFALASRVLMSQTPQQPRRFPVEARDPRRYMEAALQVAEFVQTHMWDANSGKLRRSFMKGPSAVDGFADDYALVVEGLIDLYSTTGQVRWLRWAKQLQAKMDDLFWDDECGGYFSTSDNDASIKLRLKEDYDGAEPSANSIAAANLFRLAAMSSTEAASSYRNRAVRTAAAFSERLEEVSMAVPQMCCSLYLHAVGHLRQVIVAGRGGSPDLEEMLDAVHKPFTPDKVVIVLDLADQEGMEFWREENPEAVEVVEATGMTAEDKATAFICQNFTCKAPSSDPARVSQMLDEIRTPAGTTPKLVKVDVSQLKTK